MEDVYERGDHTAEWYRNWREGTGFGEHHFSPLYAPNDSNAFWERVDTEVLTPVHVLRNLWVIPKHLVWDTPGNMLGNLKNDYIDTWSESDSGVGIAQDLVFGVPNTAMTGVNGIFDTATNGYTDLWTPVVYGVPFLLLPRWITGLTKGYPPVYNVIDVIPKTTHSVGLPIRKIGVTLADEVQKGTNFVYRTLTHPMDTGDHADRYYPYPGQTRYAVDTFVPDSPATTTYKTSTFLPTEGRIRNGRSRDRRSSSSNNPIRTRRPGPQSRRR